MVLLIKKIWQLSSIGTGHLLQINTLIGDGISHSKLCRLQNFCPHVRIPISISKEVSLFPSQKF